MEQVATNGAEFGLIVRQPGKPQEILRSFVAPMLNFRYGLQTIEAPLFREAVPAIREHVGSMRCAFLIQSRELRSDVGISGLNLMGKYPLFALVPENLTKSYEAICSRMKNAFVISWEQAFDKRGSLLQEMVENIFENNGIARPFEDHKTASYDALQQQVETRLGTLEALPTMPGMIRHIMRLLSDPETPIRELERVLATDPAVVQKIYEVVNSPVFAPIGAQGELSLKEAIVRLGLREVGAIAMQIMIISSFAQISDSLFDFRRHWGHSVCCALAADRIYKSGIADFGDVSFHEYWLGGLLHDVGKLVLGFFFWEHFARVLGETVLKGIPFHEAERQLAPGVDHEDIGKLLALKADLGPEITEWVAKHDTPMRNAKPLHCLLHLANNFCKDLGLSYPQEKGGDYSPQVLRQLDLDETDLHRLRDSIGEGLVSDLKQLMTENA